MRLTTRIETIGFAVASAACGARTSDQSAVQPDAPPSRLQQTMYFGGPILTMAGDEPQYAEAHIANRGREQAMSISPMRDSIDAGLHPTNHTDFVVAPLDQMMMLWTAVNRVSRGGEVIGTDQRVTPYEALKAMTIWVAEQYDEQHSKGTIEEGKLADLVILSDNPVAVDPMGIRDIEVLETIKEGQIVYRAP